jgi:hypothetical protein
MSCSWQIEIRAASCPLSSRPQGRRSWRRSAWRGRGAQARPGSRRSPPACAPCGPGRRPGSPSPPPSRWRRTRRRSTDDAVLLLSRSDDSAGPASCHQRLTWTAAMPPATGQGENDALVDGWPHLNAGHCGEPLAGALRRVGDGCGHDHFWLVRGSLASRGQSRGSRVLRLLLPRRETPGSRREARRFS